VIRTATPGGCATLLCHKTASGGKTQSLQATPGGHFHLATISNTPKKGGIVAKTAQNSPFSARFGPQNRHPWGVLFFHGDDLQNAPHPPRSSPFVYPTTIAPASSCSTSPALPLRASARKNRASKRTRACRIGRVRIIPYKFIRQKHFYPRAC